MSQIDADNGMTYDGMKGEVSYLEGGTGASPIFPGKATSARIASERIMKFTESWPEPFSDKYPFANPWMQKKDNKGKKDRPAGPSRPPPIQDL